MVIICKEIYQNLTIIASPFGNEQAGFLVIMMPNALYIQCIDDISANANTMRHEQILIQHKANKRLLDSYKALVLCVQNQCQEFVHDDCLAKLEDPGVRLSTILPIVI